MKKNNLFAIDIQLFMDFFVGLQYYFVIDCFFKQKDHSYYKNGLLLLNYNK